MTPAERETALAFLRALFPEIPSDAAICIWTLKDRRSHWATSHEQAVQLADASGGEDVYVGCCLQPRGLSPRTRGKASTALVMTSFWADVDFMDPTAHKGGKVYPPTLEAARALCEDMPFLPSCLVASGHGLQPWWLLREPWVLRTAADRAEAARMIAGWQRILANKAAAKGWAMDSTQDLARCLRLPGTVNTKNAAEPRNVATLYLGDGRRYNPEDTEEYMPAEVDVRAQAQLPAKAGKGKGGDGGDSGQGWTLNPQAMAPAEKLALALAQVEGFADTWRRKRKLHGPRGDQSLSAFDFSLAVMMIRLGWTDQQIVDGLVQFRREQGEPKLRVDYYKTTLARARQVGAPSELDELIEECEAQRDEAKNEEQDQPQPQPPSERSDIPADSCGTFSRGDVSDKKREVARKMVSGWLEFRVERIEQTRSEDPTFTLVTEHGTIKIGPVSVLHRQEAFRSAVWTMTHERPPKLKGKQWDPMVNSLGDLTIIVDVGTEATPKGRALAKVSAYLEAQPPVDMTERTEEMFVEPGSPLLVNGQVWFAGEHFGAWHSGRYRSERLSARDRGMMFRALGGKQGGRRWPASGGRMGRAIKAWRIQAEIFDEDDQ